MAKPKQSSRSADGDLRAKVDALAVRLVRMEQTVAALEKELHDLYEAESAGDRP